MGILRERIERRKAIRAQVRAEARQSEEYYRLALIDEAYDVRDLESRTPRSTTSQIKRSLERTAKSQQTASQRAEEKIRRDPEIDHTLVWNTWDDYRWCETISELELLHIAENGGPAHSAAELMPGEMRLNAETGEWEPVEFSERWARDMLTDIVNNFMYQTWFRAVAAGSPHSYGTSSMEIAARAVVELLAYRQQGEWLLTLKNFYNQPLPTREEAIRFVQYLETAYGDKPPRGGEYMRVLLDWMPDAWNAIDVLLREYGNVVRAQRRIMREQGHAPQERIPDTPLPDDPDHQIVNHPGCDPFEQYQLNLAVQAYNADPNADYKALALCYGVPRRKLHRELSARGCLRQRGGDRRAA